MPAQNQTAQRVQPPRLPNWLRIALVGRNPKVTLARIGILVVTCFIIFQIRPVPHPRRRHQHVADLPDGSVHLVSRTAYLWHEPQCGDVVSIRLAGPHVMYMKRVIGLPGETVAFVNGQVLIDGQVLDEPYEKLACDWNLPPEKLGPNEYFVVGDNRSMPPEWHTFGKASRDRIIGKLLL